MELQVHPRSKRDVASEDEQSQKIQKMGCYIQKCLGLLRCFSDVGLDCRETTDQLVRASSSQVWTGRTWKAEEVVDQATSSRQSQEVVERVQRVPTRGCSSVNWIRGYIGTPITQTKKPTTEQMLQRDILNYPEITHFLSWFSCPSVGTDFWSLNPGICHLVLPEILQVAVCRLRRQPHRPRLVCGPLRISCEGKTDLQVAAGSHRLKSVAKNVLHQKPLYHRFGCLERAGGHR